MALAGHTRLRLLTPCQRGRKRTMTMTRMQPQSTTHDRLLDSSNLDLTHSHIQVPNTLYAHSQGQFTHREDLLQDRVLNDSTHTHNIRPTTSYHLAIKLIMTRRYEPASPHSSLLRLQSEASLSLVNLVLHRPQHPAASIPRLSAWSLSQ